MPRLKRKGVFKVFLDSSVVIAAILSSSGGSFHLFQEARSGKIKLYISSFVFTEVVRTLRKKYPAMLFLFYRLITFIPMNFVKDPSSKSVTTLISLINPDDAPVLVSALRSKAQFLITLDRNHFFTKSIEQAKLPIIICTPGEFIQKYWRKR